MSHPENEVLAADIEMLLHRRGLSLTAYQRQIIEALMTVVLVGNS